MSTPTEGAAGPLGLAPGLLEILACPRCHADLRADEDAAELVCTGAECGLAFPVRDGIPVLLIDEARDPQGVRGGSGATGEGSA